MSTDSTQPEQQKSQDEVVREGYAFATKTLRAEHLQEARDLQQQYVNDNGYPDWRPPLTAREKAEKELDDLIGQHPHLEDVLRKRYGLDGDEAFPEEEDEPLPV